MFGADKVRSETAAEKTPMLSPRKMRQFTMVLLILWTSSAVWAAYPEWQEGQFLRIRLAEAFVLSFGCLLLKLLELPINRERIRGRKRFRATKMGASA
jgi:hypothetical protein